MQVYRKLRDTKIRVQMVLSTSKRSYWSQLPSVISLWTIIHANSTSRVLLFALCCQARRDMISLRRLTPLIYLPSTVYILCASHRVIPAILSSCKIKMNFNFYWNKVLIAISTPTMQRAPSQLYKLVKCLVTVLRADFSCASLRHFLIYFSVSCIIILLLCSVYYRRHQYICILNLFLLITRAVFGHGTLLKYVFVWPCLIRAFFFDIVAVILRYMPGKNPARG